MNPSQRSKLSLCQLFNLFDKDQISLLLEKHGLGNFYFEEFDLAQIKEAVQNASDEQIGEILAEVLRTRQTLRSEISPRYRFEERWRDLLLCLELDGYRIGLDEYGSETNFFAPVEPAIEGGQALEDDLTSEIRRSELPEADKIVQVINNSADAFRREDFNACLNSARVALQSLATSIAQQWQENQPGNFNSNRWGEVVAYLRKSKFITEEHETGLTGVFRFVSPGSHTLVLGGSKQEFARLGRSLALGFCYFLIKQFDSEYSQYQASERLI